MTVAELLTASRSAHVRYRQVASTRPTCHHVAPQVAEISSALGDAYILRQRAHDADPDHRDPAWASDLAQHDELMAFYRKFLGANGGA